MDTRSRSSSSNGTSKENTRDGADGRYSYSSGQSYESDNEHYHDDDYRRPFSSSTNAAPNRSVGNDNGGNSHFSEFQPSNTDMFMRDVPMDGERILANHHGNLEETIIEFDHGDSSYTPGRRKSNQEYYDVLEMANKRLSDKKKKKKSKKKSKKKKQLVDAMEKFKQALKRSDSDWEYSTDGMAAVTPQISQGLSQREMLDYSIDDDNDANEFDPNNEVPRSSIWKPATLVSVVASKNNDGKLDRDGYYKPINGAGHAKKHATIRATGASMIYEVFRNLFQPSEEVPVHRDFNLQSLTQRRDTGTIDQSLQSSTDSRAYDDSIDQSTKKKLKHSESIVWADESIVGSSIRQESDNDIEMHDYSYGDTNAASQDYRYASERVAQKMSWRRERRVLCCLLSFGAIFLSVCIALYVIGSKSGSGENSSYSMPPPILIPKNNTINRDDPPPRPDPLPPGPVQGFNGDISHPITADDLDFVVKRITVDQSILSDSNSPQGKAYAWCKGDLMNNSIDDAERLAQRYSLVVLYFATKGGDSGVWKNSTNWLTGHECNWYGIRCELGEDNVMSVTYIDLNNNALEGTIPFELGYVTNLTQLQLWGNNLYGTIPQSFLQLVNLQSLYLDKNKLTGEIYNTVESMRSLKHLDLSFNKLKGKIPHGLGSISSLIDLRLSNNHFSGGFPVSFEALPNLQTLLLDNNAIGGTLPASIAKLPSLVTLRIHENDLIGSLPDFTNAIYLEEAHLDENDFSGSLPTFGSKRLRSLYLGRNAFTGTIPESFGELTKLEDLYIQANHLVGPIPASISKLTALQQLDLSFNRLTGPIPVSLSDLMQLRELVLNDNRLTGNIPDIGSMKRIEIARFNNNLLSGDLKFSLGAGKLNYLQEFSFQNNDLRGVVPEYICDLLLNVLTADCWGPASPVDCPCCSACF
eukprot:CCRYP_005331-RB/>CCRYP_005331-RB protein AED:0.16 eAED:0.16 QI:75/1/1/1/0.75/0.66/9/402/921